MTKNEARAARKAAAARGESFHHANDTRAEVQREYRHAVRMDRWARRYDALNGAPEGESDQ